MADSGSAEAGAGDGREGGDAAVVAYWEALHDFADRLNAFHISCGAPSYRDIAKASREPKLSQAGITEFLKGRRLPQLKALMEFVRVVRAEPYAVTGEAASLDAVQEEWRSRWTHVRGLQRQAQDPLGHLKTTVKATLDQADQEAEALRCAARGEAARIRADAEAAADRLTASAKQQADELLRNAREQAGLQAEHDTTAPVRTAPSTTRRPRPGLSRRAAAAAAVTLAVSATVTGVVMLLHQHGPGPCRSVSRSASSPAVPVAYAGFQPAAGAAREQAGAGRVPDGFPTSSGWHMPTGTFTPPSASASASASSPASAGSSPSASPAHPTNRPSASTTSSAHDCR
ncbi:hypothetical protein ACF1AO_30070 [Streptomyces longwoodensis]|uniref:hypothetical protein n=1 Tax=Streptomyces longwoodensis TaxID=68231 RepID=UPI0036F85CF1